MSYVDENGRGAGGNGMVEGTVPSAPTLLGALQDMRARIRELRDEAACSFQFSKEAPAEQAGHMSRARQCTAIADELAKYVIILSLLVGDPE